MITKTESIYETRLTGYNLTIRKTIWSFLFIPLLINKTILKYN